jgi:hypothetical protein
MDELYLLKKRLEEKFITMSETMVRYKFTRENYDMLFPDSKIITPIGKIKMGGHQFEKLKVNDREDLLGAMYQTLKDPIIINKTDNAKKALLFIKSFKTYDSEKINMIMSVVVEIGNIRVSISTHRKDIKNILNKIKKATNLIYEKPDCSRTAGNDSANPAISGDTRLI